MKKEKTGMEILSEAQEKLSNEMWEAIKKEYEKVYGPWPKQEEKKDEN